MYQKLTESEIDVVHPPCREELVLERKAIKLSGNNLALINYLVNYTLPPTSLVLSVLATKLCMVLMSN
jgi:hypothetical protein